MLRHSSYIYIYIMSSPSSFIQLVFVEPLCLGYLMSGTMEETKMKEGEKPCPQGVPTLAVEIKHPDNLGEQG